MQNSDLEQNSSVSQNIEDDLTELRKVQEEISKIDDKVGSHLGPIATTKPKNKWVAVVLCLFLGFLGIHKFYEGRIIWGLIYLFSGGIFGIGVIYDLIVLLLFRSNPYFIDEN